MRGGYLLLFAGVHWAGFTLDTNTSGKNNQHFNVHLSYGVIPDCIVNTRCMPKGYLFNFPCDVKRQTPTKITPSTHPCEGCMLM
jgi:hypothetical protein